MMQRRQFLTLASTAAAIGVSKPCLSQKTHDESADPVTLRFGFSLYGMKSLAIPQAIQTCARIGYDCVELPVMSDWSGAPEKLGGQQRREISDCLSNSQLRLSGLMENLRLIAEPPLHRENMDRLKAAAQLGHDLSPGDPPVIETVLGGRPADWDSVRQEMAERLGDWAEAGRQSETVIAIKAHVSGAAHRPEHVRWLHEQVHSPWIKAVYDFSHFQLRGLDLKESLTILASNTVFIHIKDAIGDQNKFQFTLPGEGTIDYVRYLKLLRETSCRADILVEVSGQIHSKPDYDPLAAAQTSWARIAPCFEKAGIIRP